MRKNYNPEIKIVKKNVFDLTSQECKMCSNLTMRYAGEMSETLSTIRKNKTKQEYVYMAKDELTGQLLGWCLCHYEKYSFKRHCDAFLYVRQSQRRKGIGSLLLDEAKNELSRIKVYPHDRVSKRFFKANSQGLILSNSYCEF